MKDVAAVAPQVEAQSKVTEKAELSAFMIKERKKRTVFVGNVPIDTSAK